MWNNLLNEVDSPFFFLESKEKKSLKRSLSKAVAKCHAHQCVDLFSSADLHGSRSCLDDITEY